MLKRHSFNRILQSILTLGALLAIAAPTVAQETRARYLVIPVHGQIGKDTLAAGFTEAFQRAGRDKFTTCVVFTFNSDGGSEIDAEKIIEVIEGTGDRFQRVAVVTKCIGPALGILLTCDHIYITEPQPKGVVLEFQAAWTGDSGDIDQELQRQQALYRKLVSGKPSWKPVIEAMIDPTETLYAWNVSSDEIRTSNTKPDVKAEVVHIGLSNSLGVSAKDAIAAGLAKQLNGGPAAIGRALGYETFNPSTTSGSVVMANAVDARTKGEQEVNSTIEHAFNSVGTALDLVHDLPRQQYSAQQADPRNMEYRSSYVRSWRDNRWRYTSPSLSAWRRNTDHAIEQWQVVLNSLDRIATLGNEARDDVRALEKHSANWPSDAPQHEALKLLQKELDSLMSQDASLGVMRDQAADQINFFNKNRNNPVL